MLVALQVPEGEEDIWLPRLVHGRAPHGGLAAHLQDQAVLAGAVPLLSFNPGRAWECPVSLSLEQHQFLAGRRLLSSTVQLLMWLKLFG